MTPLARLVYQALWCEADRDGRLVWDPETLKLRYFPVESFEEIQACCDAILTRGHASRYVNNGREYAVLPTFLSHQHINPRETASALPGPTDSGSKWVDLNPNGSTRKARVADASARVGDAQGGRERKGKEGKGIPNGSAGAQGKPWEVYLFGLLPEGHQTDDLKKALTAYGRLRIQKKWGGLADITCEQNAEDWAKIPVEQVIAGLYQSVKAGWRKIVIEEPRVKLSIAPGDSAPTTSAPTLSPEDIARSIELGRQQDDERLARFAKRSDS